MERITIGFKIKTAPGMAPTQLIIQSEQLSQNELDNMRDPDDPSIVAGELMVGINFKSITMVLRGVGEPYTRGSFNLMFNGKAVFADDEDLPVLKTGRFDFFKTNIKLP
jgi:hypothetical protein